MLYQRPIDMETFQSKFCLRSITPIDQFSYIDQIFAIVTEGLLPNPWQRCQKLVDQFSYIDQISATVTKELLPNPQ